MQKGILCAILKVIELRIVPLALSCVRPADTTQAFASHNENGLNTAGV